VQVLVDSVHLLLSGSLLLVSKMALQQNLYPLFKGTNKQKLSKDFDQFDRDHAPLYQLDEWKRLYSIASSDLDRAFAKIRALPGAPFDEPMQHEIIEELAERERMIKDGDQLRKEVLRVLGVMKKYSTKIDVESTRIRKQIADHVLSILPDAKQLLDEINLHIDGEMTRLNKRNVELIEQNTLLKANAGNSKDAVEMRALLDKMHGKLQKTERVNEDELARLRTAEASYTLERGRWEAGRESFERREKEIRQELEKARQQSNEANIQHNCVLDQAKREKAEARRKFGQLVQQKERVDEELNNERQKAMDQKMRADDLEMELRTAQQGNRDKDDKIDKLERKVQRMDMEFEWVKGRSLEYYGSLKAVSQDNEAL
jgi:hypothetical protein